MSEYDENSWLRPPSVDAVIALNKEVTIWQWLTSASLALALIATVTLGADHYRNREATQVTSVLLGPGTYTLRCDAINGRWGCRMVENGVVEQMFFSRTPVEFRAKVWENWSNITPINTLWPLPGRGIATISASPSKPKVEPLQPEIWYREF